MDFDLELQIFSQATCGVKGMCSADRGGVVHL